MARAYYNVMSLRHPSPDGFSVLPGAAAGAIVVGLATVVAMSAAQNSGTAFSFEIVPGQRFGSITENTSRTALVSLASGRPVRDGDVHLGEGICTDGTLVFAGTSDEVEVAWQDRARTRVAFARVRRGGGQWRTRRGVSIGTRLADLERIAGHPVTFAGFEWDYGGGMTWEEPTGEIRLTLAVDPADMAKVDRDLVGDRLVRSDHPLAKVLRITVAEMSLVWDAPATEHDCG